MDQTNKQNEFEFVYVFIYGSDWEDTVIILSKEDAIEISKNTRILG
jgi:hypothetical protein